MKLLDINGVLVAGSDGSDQSRDGDEPGSVGGEDRDTDQCRTSLVRPVI